MISQVRQEKALPSPEEYLKRNLILGGLLYYLGSEHFRNFADYITDLGKESPEWFAGKVNEKNKAGVFHPKLDLTLLPMSRYGDRDDFGNAQIMVKHVEDVFKANEEYCAKEEICFDLHGEKNFDTATFERKLNWVLANQKQWKCTKKVSLVRKGDSNE